MLAAGGGDVGGGAVGGGDVGGGDVGCGEVGCGDVVVVDGGIVVVVVDGRIVVVVAVGALEGGVVDNVVVLEELVVSDAGVFVVDVAAMMPAMAPTSRMATPRASHRRRRGRR